MPYIEPAPGRRLFYRLDGPQDAPALLLSNSLGVDHQLWAPQMPELERRFRVIRYDARGHGRSSAPDGEYRIESLAEDAVALLDALQVERASFCGISMGGAIGQQIAANAPERIDRLVLANTAAVFATPDIWQGRLELVQSAGMSAVVEGTIERWFTPDFRAREPGRVDEIKALLLATSPQGYAGCCAALRDTEGRPLLAAIRAPTLVIVGAQDTATPPEAGEVLSAGIAGARLTALDAAHLSNLEQPQAFTQALLQFLA